MSPRERHSCSRRLPLAAILLRGGDVEQRAVLHLPVADRFRQFQAATVVPFGGFEVVAKIGEQVADVGIALGHPESIPDALAELQRGGVVREGLVGTPAIVMDDPERIVEVRFDPRMAAR